MTAVAWTSQDLEAQFAADARVDAAVAESAEKDEVVRLTCTTAYERTAVTHALWVACDDFAEGEETEFWGVDAHGDYWRVHVPRLGA